MDESESSDEKEEIVDNLTKSLSNLMVGLYYGHLRSVCWGMFEQTNQGAVTVPAWLARLFEILLYDNQQRVQYPSINNVDVLEQFLK